MAKSVAAQITDLETRRDAVLTQLAAMTSTSVGGLPNATGGESIDHEKHRKGLYDELKMINETITLLDSDWTVDEYIES